MKNLKINVLLALLFSLGMLLSSITVNAQENGSGFRNKTPEQRAQVQTNLMKAKLNLDSIQTIQVGDINLKYAKKFASVFDGRGGKFSKFRQMKSIQQQKNVEFKKVLNSDQYNQYLQFEGKMKEKFKDRARSRHQ